MNETTHKPDVRQLLSDLPREQSNLLMAVLNEVAGVGSSLKDALARGTQLNEAIIKRRTDHAMDTREGYQLKSAEDERASHVDSVWQLFQLGSQRPDDACYREHDATVEEQTRQVYSALAELIAALKGDSDEPGSRESV